MSHIWTGPPPTVTEPLIKGTSTNPFCGPAAIALCLNQPLDYVDQLLSYLLGDSVQRGIFYPEVLKVLQSQGCEFKEISYRLLKFREKGIYLISFKTHFGVMKDRIYYDNQHGNGSVVMPKMRVEKVFQIWRP